MSGRRLRPAARDCAPIFAALGDETRLGLVRKLCARSPQSISRLASGAGVTRQAITKHLRALEGAGIVRSIRRGRESLFELHPEPLARAQNYLELVSAQWDEALERLRNFVER